MPSWILNPLKGKIHIVSSQVQLEKRVSSLTYKNHLPIRSNHRGTSWETDGKNQDVKSRFISTEPSGLVRRVQMEKVCSQQNCTSAAVITEWLTQWVIGLIHFYECPRQRSAVGELLAWNCHVCSFPCESQAPNWILMMSGLSASLIWKGQVAHLELMSFIWWLQYPICAQTPGSVLIFICALTTPLIVSNRACEWGGNNVSATVHLLLSPDIFMKYVGFMF